MTGWRWWLSEMWGKRFETTENVKLIYSKTIHNQHQSLFFFCWIFQFGLIIRAFFVFIFQFSFFFTISHSELLFCVPFHFHYQLDGRFLAQLMAAAEKRQTDRKNGSVDEMANDIKKKLLCTIHYQQLPIITAAHQHSSWEEIVQFSWFTIVERATSVCERERDEAFFSAF